MNVRGKKENKKFMHQTQETKEWKFLDNRTLAVQKANKLIKIRSQ